MLPNIINALLPKRRPDGLDLGLLGNGDDQTGGFFPQMPRDKGWMPGVDDFDRDPGFTAPKDLNASPVDAGFSPPPSRFFPPEPAELQQRVFEYGGKPEPESLVAPPPAGQSEVVLSSPGIERPGMLDRKKYDEKGNLKFDYETNPAEIVRRAEAGEKVGKSKWWKRALRGALDGLATGNGIGGALGGAMAGAAIEGFWPGSYQKMRTAEKVNEAKGNIDYQNQQDYQKARTENIRSDNTRAQKQAEALDDWRKAETKRKTDNTQSREHTSRMNAVAGMFKNIPVYDPADPKFAELTQALGDVNLPITPKDAKKKIDLKQDQRTGLWTVILTDPISGKQEVRNVIKDGKPFTSTPTVVMQGEVQNRRLDETVRHNMMTERQAAERLAALNEARKVAEGFRQQELNLRKSGQMQEADAFKLKQDAFRQRMMERVTEGKMTQEDFDEIFPEVQGPKY